MRAGSTFLIGVVVAVAACGGGDDPGGDGGDIGDDVGDGDYCESVASWSADRADAEEEVVAIVNQRRAQGADCGGEGSFGPAEALTMDSALRCAARVHTQDMADNGYFDHKNPAGEEPWDRMQRAGYSWSRAGENIAGGATTAEDVVDQWMDSDGHCANIMSPDFVHIGVGYVDDARLWTQVFGAPSR
jgi:uncharacterized protein YkwD